MTKEEQTISNLRKLKSFHNGSYGADIDRAIKALEQEPKTDYKSFCEWVASEVIDKENWEWNSGSFPEVACRKLNKLGVVGSDGKRWIYEDESIEQKPQSTITQQITESNQQITKSLQDSLKAGGSSATMLNYELSAIDRRLADISVTLAMIVDRLGGEG